MANDDTDEHVVRVRRRLCRRALESKCNREPDIEAYFVEQGYSQQYNYVAEYASRVLKLGVCGVRVRHTRLSQPKCVANGQSQAALDSGFSRYTNVTGRKGSSVTWSPAPTLRSSTTPTASCLWGLTLSAQQ